MAKAKKTASRGRRKTAKKAAKGAKAKSTTKKRGRRKTAKRKKAAK